MIEFGIVVRNVGYSRINTMYEKMQEFFDKYNIEPKKENARSFIFDCPACGGSSKLYIEKTNGRSICFKHKTEHCPTPQTPLAKVLSLISAVPYEDIKNILTEKITITVGETLPEPIIQNILSKVPPQKIIAPLEPIKPHQYPPGLIPIRAPDNNGDIINEGTQYLLNRGLDIKSVENFGVCYSIYMRRVVFPVLHQNKCYGWQARTIDKNVKPRMYNLPGTWKARTLMFYDNIVGSEFAIVAEGAISALKFALVGGFVATMGKLISNEQLDLILGLGIKKIFLALDPDAIKEMCEIVCKIYNTTNGLVKCFLIKVPNHKEDFGDCTYEECKTAFNMAEPIDPDCFSLYSYQMERM